MSYTDLDDWTARYSILTNTLVMLLRLPNARKKIAFHTALSHSTGSYLAKLPATTISASLFYPQMDVLERSKENLKHSI